MMGGTNCPLPKLRHEERDWSTFRSEVAAKNRSRVNHNTGDESCSK